MGWCVQHEGLFWLKYLICLKMTLSRPCNIAERNYKLGIELRMINLSGYLGCCYEHFLNPAKLPTGKAFPYIVRKVMKSTVCPQRMRDIRRP